jgi:hypothetical protein
MGRLDSLKPTSRELGGNGELSLSQAAFAAQLG